MADSFKIRGIEFLFFDCKTCGVPYAVPKVAHEGHQEHGGYAYCSNGHAWGWDESSSERARERRVQEQIRRDRDNLQQRIAQKDDEIRETAKKLEKVQKENKRQKVRAMAGVCSCCNRQFKDLQRHMASKHKGRDPVPHGSVTTDKPH